MRSGRAKVVEFWEAALCRVQAYKAKAFLREDHANLLRKHQGLETKAEAENIAPMLVVEQPRHEPLSPLLLNADDEDEAIDPEFDQAELGKRREAVAAAHHHRPGIHDQLELKALEAMGSMEEGDAVFGSGARVNFDSQVYWWHDKYRPRKPKYLNRIITGFSWNRYNSTHYDNANPPPKRVLAYKFNLFYPDLIDKSKAPTYTEEKDEDGNGETSILRFHAGPPYEDIGFRIVHKDWERSQKKGFKSTFDRGILQLYFNFKQYRYSR